DDADDLIGRLRRHQRARVDEYASTRHEGVEVVIVNKHDLDSGARKACGLENGRGIFSDQRLNLGVAHHRHPALRLRGRYGGGKPVSESKKRGKDAWKKRCTAVEHHHGWIGRRASWR